jgi:hypothetical protein
MVKMYIAPCRINQHSTHVYFAVLFLLKTKAIKETVVVYGLRR